MNAIPPEVRTLLRGYYLATNGRRAGITTLGLLVTLFAGLSSIFKTRAALQLENVALRHQLSVQHHSVKRPKLTTCDLLVKPETAPLWLSA